MSVIITRGARPLLGDKDIVFIKNHGVMVRAPNIAEARHDLHYLERAAEVQLKTMGSGCKLLPVLPAVAADAGGGPEKCQDASGKYPPGARPAGARLSRLIG